MTRESIGQSPARRRSGSALLDVTVSLALLGLSGTVMIALLAQTASTMQRVRDTDRELRRASDELGFVASTDRSALSAMSGQSLQRGWIITITERATNLFDVDIADTNSRLPLLHTTVYRADTSHARSPD